ncbi:MAG: NAD(P)/FAD-dependent oxidoreductase [Clostridia bacterium]|nr:NAD(P)/FAD-dependent oxidoreductase [Clostridia bacterium]
MGKKIIIAGGGHGGIGCGALLAQKGFDVTVYEKNSRNEMGYDWTDIFDKKGFAAIGMDMPDDGLWRLKYDMTFFGPGMTTKLRQDTPVDQLEIQMERRALYDCIIAYAEKCGVKFEYSNAVEAPVMLGNRVVGIKTEKGEYYADLVIDACGMNSPLRRKLPEHLGIQNEAQAFESFYVWRAFFEKGDFDGKIEDKFKLFLLPKGELGISWIDDEEKYTDVLIGRFEPLTEQRVEKLIDDMRKDYPSIGKKILRGGSFAQIPVRQPLGVLVADGYAAIGDSAFMTVPIIGSGIANSMKAAKILAETIIADETESFSAAVLWKYQKDFFSKTGNGLAPLAPVKLLLTRLEPIELDYIFERGILNADDMTISADSTSLASMVKDMLDPEPLKAKIKGLAASPVVLKKIMRMIKDIAAVTVVTTVMPQKYDIKRVYAWSEMYNKCFKR